MYDKALELLKKYEQEHLLNFYDELSNEEQKQLLNQISNIDFKTIDDLYLNLGSKDVLDKKIEPVFSINACLISNDEKEKYIECGKNIIKQKKYAVVTMAGGQGTRLGHNGPKGTFKLHIDGKDVSLFEIFCNQLKKIKEEYDVYIDWYIMTSEENNKVTEDFFEENNFFGYDKNSIHFFSQGKLPMVNTSGKILLESKYKIKEAADGNGGIFEAMYKNNVLSEMKEKNIEWIFTCGVDNPLVKMVDPLFIGFNASNNYKIGVKSVMKNSPFEKVGVFCTFNGKPKVIEYTELPKELAIKLNLKNELMYGDSYIVMSLFNISVLDEIAREKLPFHVALKKSSYVSADGEIVEPTEPNAYKFESFLFDAFVKIDKLVPFRIKREEEFAPIKNKEGVDSPETSTKLYLNAMK